MEEVEERRHEERGVGCRERRQEEKCIRILT